MHAAAELRGITKRFPGGVLALDGVDLAIAAGEIHALVGENGAGKSTLMNVFFGIHEPDEGEITLGGRPVRHRSPAEALAGGVAMVHQHFKLVPTFTVAENVALTVGGGRRLDLDAVRRTIDERAARYGLPIDPDAEAGELPLAAQQRVEILKALMRDPAVLILDEPTTVLTPTQSEALFRVLRLVRDEGRAVVLISHHLDEVFASADRISVLRGGRLVGSAPTPELTKAGVARMVVGRDVEDLRPRRRAGGAAEPEPVLELLDATVAGEGASPGLQGVSLALRPGEVLAVAGVEGNGQRELFDVLTGLRRPAGGRLLIGGEEVAIAGRRAFARHGISLIPEDRHAEALFSEMTVAENLVVDRIGRRPYSRWGWLRRRAIASAAEEAIAEFGVRTRSHTAAAGTLSGGNQQKVVLARALGSQTRVLVAHQATRGLDLGATAQILDRLTAAAREGAAVVFLSSSLDEILAMGDRIVVLYRGRIAGAGEAGSVSREQLGRWMTGMEEPVPA